MIIIAINVFMLFCFGCSSIPHVNHAKEVKLVTQIQAKLAKRLASKHHLSLSGDVTAMPGGVIKEVGLLFHSHRILSIEEAREILVDCVQEFLSEINTNEEIRPFLENYPFTPKNIDIAIFIKDSNGIGVYDPNLNTVSASSGKLYYKTVSKDDTFNYKSEYKETFDEAFKLVNQAHYEKDNIQ